MQTYLKVLLSIVAVISMVTLPPSTTPVPTNAAQNPGTAPVTYPVLVSVSSDEVQSNYHSESPIISPDGRYVVFSSSGGNLVPDDTNGTVDVFLRDTLLETTIRISTDLSGIQADGDFLDLPSRLMVDTLRSFPMQLT